jgi:hypothetical protein
MKLAFYLVFGGAFLPTAYFLSRYVRSNMHPAEPRSGLMFVFGVLLLLAGFGAVAVAFHGVHTGVAQCLLKACEANLEFATGPIGFVLMVLWSYLVGLLLASIGIAGMRKAFDIT